MQLGLPPDRFLVLINVSLAGEMLGKKKPAVPVDDQALALLEEHFTFMIASDLGRNGYYDQKPVAEMMGIVADYVEPDFVATLGDIHHLPHFT